VEDRELHYRLHRDPRSSHQQIARIVRRLGATPILDVGAAQGILGQLAGGDGLVLDAVEPHPGWAERARPHYRAVYTSTIEAAPLAPASYRVVVCGDVLEHTVDPIAVLGELRRVATPDAIFVVSLPHVAHLAVRLMLLFGRFPQMERGILDRTHLHFYTRDTAEALLRAAGLRVARAYPTGIPLDELWPGGEGSPPYRLLQRLQWAALRLAPRLFAFQWIFVAYPDEAAPRGKGDR
jgi:2-polyprenyl-3-methyl-5-hydroxy-6-metoxy-1,4-benzoquinol methylase